VSAVLSIRIPRELKEKMRELRDVDWRGEVVSFLIERVKYYERLRIIREVRKIIDEVPAAEPGTASRYVREDRDSN